MRSIDPGSARRSERGEAQQTMTETAVLPIRRRSLHDELVERLRLLIVEGDLAPGSKISEKDLSDLFAVSRTPLREALKVLAREGLVELSPNRGASVAALTLDDLEEAFPVMGALEALSGELACRAITSRELTQVEAQHRAMLEAYERRDMPAYFKHNQAIHQAILDAARNPTLEQMQSALAGRIRRARYMANMSEDRWAKAVAEHEDILTALKARDGERLAQILKRHLANKLATVREHLQSVAEAEERQQSRA